MFSKLRFSMTDKNPIDEEVIVNDNVNEEENQALDTSLSSECEPPAKRQRFEASSSKSSHSKWDLSDDLAGYLNDKIVSFVKDSDLQESILIDNPVPSNIVRTKRLDTAFKEILEEQHKKAILFNEDVLINIQNKVFNVYGPLTKLWATMEAEKTELVEASGQDQLTFDSIEHVNKVSTGFEQTITLLGQAVNAIVYQRRLSALTSIFNDRKKAKELLSDKKEMMDEDKDRLFGSKFEESVVKTQKTKVKTKELIGAASSSSRTNTSNRSTRPFRGGPPPRGSRGGGRGFAFFGRGFNYRGGAGSYQNRGGKISLSRNSSFKKFSQSPSNCTKPFSKCDTSSSFSRETEIFSQKLESPYKRLNDIRDGSGLPNSICEGGTMPTKATKSITNEFLGTGNSRTGNPQYDREGSHKESGSLSGSVLKHIVYSEEEGRRQPSCNKPETSQLPHSLSTFQDGRAPFVERFVERKRLHGETRSKRCLFFSSIRKQVKKVCKISVERRGLSIPMPLLRSGTCSQAVYKVDENSNCHSAKDQHKSDSLPGRYIINGQKLGGNSGGKGHFDFLASKSRFLNQSKKVSTPTSSTDRVFGSQCRFSKDGIEFAIRKSEQNNLPMQGFIRSESGVDSTANKASGKINLHSSSCSPSPTSLQTYPKGSNKESSIKRSYQAYIVLSEKVKEEITWWMENLRLCNGKSLLTISPNLTISSDASKIGWGQHARECQRGALGPGRKPKSI